MGRTTRAGWAWAVLLAWATGAAGAANAAEPEASAWARSSVGRIERVEAFPSARIGPRNIDVWLPTGYPDGGPYAVLYMFDGQMLFDADTTWNHQEWRADEVADALIASGEVRPFLIVGIWNAGAARPAEYFPQRAFESLPPGERQALVDYYAERAGAERRPVYSDRFLDFLVRELKPFVDRRYAVRTGPEDTMVMGSSLGGLAAMYALAEFPDVFGGAACLSTHWPGKLPDSDDNPVPAAIYRYIGERFPPPGHHRIYFDHGTETLDASYARRQKEVDRLLAAKGYRPGRDWVTRTFPGAEHNEQAWSARLAIPLEFLFGTPPARQ